MSHEEGHEDIHQFGGFVHGVWLVVRRPIAFDGFDELDPESYHRLVHAIGGGDHNPIRGLAFLVGSSLGWQDRIVWRPDATGEDWQRLQYMLNDKGEDPDNPEGGGGRNDLQHVDTAVISHTGEDIEVAAFFEVGYGGYTHPIADALGIDATRLGLSRTVEGEVVLNPTQDPGPDGPPEGAPEPSEAGLIWPCCFSCTRCFGMEPGAFGGPPKFHYGIDLPCPEGLGVGIPATHDGTVIFSGGNIAVGYGLYVDVWDSELGIGTRYAHLLELAVVEGQEVLQGDVIGLMGSTGSSTGPHLHFEVHLATPFNNDNAVDPLIYMPTECEDTEFGGLPPGVQGPVATFTSVSVEGLSGMIISFVGNEWKEGPNDPAHTSTEGTWVRLTQLVGMVQARASLVGLVPILVALDAEDLGSQWENGGPTFDIPAWNAIQGNHFLSARAFWAPRIRGTSHEAGIVRAWHYATDAGIGFTYGRCELFVDLEGADRTHIRNMILAAINGVDVTGLRRLQPSTVDTVTSGIVFLDDVQRVLDQGIAGGLADIDWDDMFFWNYGNRWNQLLMKWAVTTPIADMEVLTAGGEAVAVENEVGLMPLMIVGDFFGRMLFKTEDWKTGQDVTRMFFETLDWVVGKSAPAYFHEIQRGEVAPAAFGNFFFELVQKDTFELERFEFAVGSDIFGLGLFSGSELVDSEWAYFGSAGLGGVHGWHINIVRGILGNGSMDSQNFIWFPVDPRALNKDHLRVPQSSTGTLGDLLIVGKRLRTPEEGEEEEDEEDEEDEEPTGTFRRDVNAQPASRLILPRRAAGSSIGAAPAYDPREFEMPFIIQQPLQLLTPAPGNFIPAPVAPLPGEPPLPGGIDPVYVSGSTTVISDWEVNNSILNRMWQDLTTTPPSGAGTFRLAFYVALMLRESGGRPDALGICLSGLGHAVGLFQLLTGADPECPGSGGMGHPYSKAELFNVETNINIARNALLDLWSASVELSGSEPPSVAALRTTWGVNPWQAAPEAIDLWIRIKDGFNALTFPLPE